MKISVLARNAGLIVLGVVMAGLVLEVVARTFHLGSGGFWEPHPTYGWRNIPDASGWESCLGECSVYVEINSNGLRDRDIPYEVAAKKRRILLLGDSMTAGMQVPLEQTFGKVLEGNLNEGSGTAQWEVVNGAVNAFGTDSELLFFRHEGYKYQPDLVVLGMYLANDIYNNKRELDLQSGGSNQKPYFVLNDSNELALMNFPVEESNTVPVQLASFLKKNLQLTRFAAQVLQLRHEVPGILRPIVDLFGGGRGVATSSPSGEDNPPSGDICDEQYSAEIEEAWAITRALINQLQDEVKAIGADLAVLVIPASPQLIPPNEGDSWYCERPNQELRTLLDDEGILYLDLLMPFREQVQAGASDFYFKKDFHMNQEGHRFAGELLAEFINETMITDGDW